MDSFLEEMVRTSEKYLRVARDMMASCRKKEKKRRSHCRLVISFFCSRAVELTESFRVLIKENRLPDAGMLLRSFWEMGINTDFIFSDAKTNEINSLRYILEEKRTNIKLLERNRSEFEADGLDVEKRLRDAKKDEEETKIEIAKDYGPADLRWPSIYERASNSQNWVIRQAYNMAYSYLCSIEHHDMAYGQNYLDVDNCEPLKVPKVPTLLRPDVNLVMWRSILLVVLKTFNDEFELKWDEALTNLGRMQDDEYTEIRRRDGKPDA